MSTPEHQNDTATKTLDQRYESIGWGLFIIMIGGLILVPDSSIPDGTWLVGTGLIMLGLNLVRYLSGIRTRGFTIGLGILAVSFGISDMFGVDLPILAFVLILCGAYIVYRNLSERTLG